MCKNRKCKARQAFTVYRKIELTCGFATFKKQTTKTKRGFGRLQEFKAQIHFEPRICVPQEKNFGFFLDWGLPGRNWSLRLTVQVSDFQI